MTRAGGGAAAAALLVLLTTASAAQAGAWAKRKGEGQLIFKYEAMRADQGFDPSGRIAPLPAQRRDEALGLFAEYGLTDRLTLQLKGDWQSGRDAFVDYEGRGPVEVGVTWQAWRDDRTAISLYGGYADDGDGRNAGYAPPGVGGRDYEVRASIGRSFGGSTGRWSTTGSFVELQAARRMRGGLSDETRVDLTAGTRFGRDWMLLGQAYGGAVDEDGGARWLSVETSVVRDLGRWSLQAGWREAVSGRETPRSSGPIVAVWRRF